jgi:hypothetical protein
VFAAIMKIVLWFGEEIKTGAVNAWDAVRWDRVIQGLIRVADPAVKG